LPKSTDNKLSSGPNNLIATYAFIKEEQGEVGSDTGINVAAPIQDGESRFEDEQASLIHKDRRDSSDFI